MKQTTITEALAELHVVDKRIQTKRQFVQQYLLRLEKLKDPLEKDGGSVSVIAREMQAIADLEENRVTIRRAIQQANERTEITVGRTTRTIADWLVWRRDVAPGTQQFLRMLMSLIEKHRQDALRQGRQVTASSETARADDVVVNLNEQALHQRIEELETILQTLDGQLSLKNATTVVSY